MTVRVGEVACKVLWRKALVTALSKGFTVHRPCYPPNHCYKLLEAVPVRLKGMAKRIVDVFHLSDIIQM